MRLAFLAAVSLCVATVAAHADPISGSITIAGNDTYNSTNINFNPSTGAVTAASGTMSAFAPGVSNNGTITNFVAALTSFSFAQANTAPGVTVFNVGNGTVADSFTITSLQSNIGPLGTLSLNGSGFFTETGYSQTPGTFALTSPTTANGFQLTAYTAPVTSPSSVTPEPSSFALLGTGLLGVVGVMRKRFA